MHTGYKLGPFQPGADLEKISMSPADAEAYHKQLNASMQSCNQVIYGELPSSSTASILLQSVVDLMCCSWDRVKLLQSALPGQQAAAGLSSVADAVNSALQAAAAVAAATASGDAAAAEAASQAAQHAAAVAEQQAQQLAAAEEPDVSLLKDLPDAPKLSLPPDAAEDEPLAAAPGVLARGTGGRCICSGTAGAAGPSCWTQHSGWIAGCSRTSLWACSRPAKGLNLE